MKAEAESAPAQTMTPERIREYRATLAAQDEQAPEPEEPEPEPEPTPEEVEGTENRLLAEARERYKNMPARKQVPGVGEMYFPEVLPSPHTEESGDEQEPKAESPGGPGRR